MLESASRGGLPGPGGSAWSGGCLPGLAGGCLPGPGGGLPDLGGYGIPACTEADTLPPLWTDTHLYKHYLGHNFIAAGKKFSYNEYRL